jgi:AraC-like DNA-binding protein
VGRGTLGDVPGDTLSVPATGGQSYVERPPVPSLSDLVSSVWVQEVSRDAAPYVHRQIPHGGVELVCRVGSAPQLIGPLTEPVVHVIEAGTTVVGVRFVPGAFPAVATQPASDMVGIAVDADEVWGRSAVALGEAVATAASPREALAALQLEVSEHARAGDPSDPLVTQAVSGLMPWRMARVTSLSASLAISETQLRRRFRATVGLAPKALQRMLRFQGFLALVQRSIAQGREPTGDGVAHLAQRVGYADQSHLTRECLTLAGVSPRVFIAETRRSCASGHDHAASHAALLRAERSVNP